MNTVGASKFFLYNFPLPSKIVTLSGRLVTDPKNNPSVLVVSGVTGMLFIILNQTKSKVTK